MDVDWQFDDAPNTAAFTTKFVLNGSPVLRVYHDFEGGWQFHGAPDHPATTDIARIVSLEGMVRCDASLAELHDLPHGWRATRPTVDSPWTREKNNSFPTYAESGYYLEDPLWMARHRNDINPPSEEIRNNLPVGAYVKLLFRFQGEEAARQDYDTERMWVLISGLGDDGHYIGILANHPNHDRVLKFGDTINFHPLHVMEVSTESGG